MLVSDQDLDLLFQVTGVYFTGPKSATPYVHLRCKKTTYAHRVIAERMIGRKLLGAERVDHINGNGTDNRRENLRVVTHAQNLMNRPGWRKSSSKYKGVTFYKRDQKWQAKICPSGKTMHLGYFDQELDAAKAYNAAAMQHFGKYAVLNEVA
jgi:hypothetical protein